MKYERFIIGGILILILFSLCYFYESNESQYSNSAIIDLSTNYSENQIFISGQVITVLNDGFKVYNTKNKNFYYIKSKSKVKINDHVYILGVLSSNNEITVTKIMITQNKDDIYVIFRSLLGMIIFLLIFGKYWKFNLKKMFFLRRN